LSIIIPVYNAERTISTTLESLNRIPAGSKEAVEVIVVNDGSTDGSLAIVQSKLQSLQPLNVSIITQTNQGLSSARNTGLGHCRGEFIFLLDADDELAFDPISYLQKYSDATALGFSIRYSKNTSPRTIKRPVRIDLRNHLNIFTAENAVTVSSLIFRKDRIRSYFKTDLFSLEDWLFWTMNPAIFEKMTVFPRVTSAVIHIHGGNMTADYETMGTSREKAAEFILEQYNSKLTCKQKNNLLVQSQIGRLLQGQKIPLMTLMLFPCSIKLYLKLIMYRLLKNNVGRFGFYSGW